MVKVVVQEATEIVLTNWPLLFYDKAFTDIRHFGCQKR